jgi:exopolysaccharide production protein ExoQ
MLSAYPRIDQFNRLRRRIEETFVVAVLLLSTGAVYAVWMSSRDPASLDRQGDLQGELVWSGLYLVVAFFSAHHIRQILAGMGAARWALFLVAFAALSVAWSGAPIFSAHRIVALLGTTLFGLYLGTRFSPLEQLRLIARSLTIGTLASLAAMFLIPSFAIQSDSNNAWRGVFDQKDAAGTWMAMSVAVLTLLAVTERRHRRLRIAVACVSLVLLIQSQCVTALMMLIGFCIASSFAGMFRLHWKAAVATLFCFLPFAVASVAWASSQFDNIAIMLGRSPTLTGRTLLWEFVIGEIAKRPILGHGYAGFWAVNGREVTLAAAGWASPHAHNGILELMLNLGIVGLVLFLLSLIVLLRRALLEVREESGPIRLWPLLFLAWLLIYNITLPGILERNSFSWILFVALSCSLHPAIQKTVGAVPERIHSHEYVRG